MSRPAPGGVCALSADPRPACDDRISQGSFQEPTAEDRRTRDPCGYCFPDGEITVAESDLLVGSHSDDRGSIHRHERTGDCTWTRNSGPKLAHVLQREDITDPSDGWSEYQGGDA